MSERKSFGPSTGLCPFSQEPGTVGGGWEKERKGGMCWDPGSSYCSLEVGVGRREEEWATRKPGIRRWGSDSCSASNLLCDFEPLASLFWSCFPTSEIRTCTRQLLWADQFRYSHSAISTERQLRFGRDHRYSCDLSQQSKMRPVCPSKVRVMGGFDLGIKCCALHLQDLGEPDC